MTVDITSLTKAALIGELETLHKEIRAAAEPLDEKQFWTKPLDPGNSFGHLVLHLTGNLNHFVGAKLGNTGYVRDREREFTETKLPAKAEALAGLEAAVVMFRRVVGGLTAEQLAAQHPESRFGSVLNTLMHLVAHFALHRGQISYIVRLVKAEKAK
ncbi:MAG TPA: DinB family protein [Gemmataceae bacterium]|nr:DinB family protein [Gemmataceae bacterium]